MASLNTLPLVAGWITALALLSSCRSALAHDPGKVKPNVAQLQLVKELIKEVYVKDPGVLPTAVRLAFHDCIGASCDGCINPGNADNKGLQPIIQALQYLVPHYAVSPFLSTADLWSLAGIVAVEEGIRISNDACKKNRLNCKEMPPLMTTFMWGRLDCYTSPFSSDSYIFPSTTMDRAQMMGYFKQQFNMNENEVTALMGAHTLGEMEVANSGHSGSWLNGEETHFNTRYYEVMRQPSVSYSNVPIDEEDSDGNGDKKFQFTLFNNGSSLGHRLNTDIELVYDIDVNKQNGTRCQLINGRIPRQSGNALEDAILMMEGPICPNAPTSKLVDNYIKYPSRFIRDFSAAYQKMMSHGNPDLQPVEMPMKDCSSESSECD